MFQAFGWGEFPSMSPTMSPRLASCFCDVNPGSFVGGIPRKKIREKPQDADSSTTNEGFFAWDSRSYKWFIILVVTIAYWVGGGSFKVYSPT